MPSSISTENSPLYGLEFFPAPDAPKEILERGLLLTIHSSAEAAMDYYIKHSPKLCRSDYADPAQNFGGEHLVPLMVITEKSCLGSAHDLSGWRQLLHQALESGRRTLAGFCNIHAERPELSGNEMNKIFKASEIKYFKVSIPRRALRRGSPHKSVSAPT